MRFLKRWSSLFSSNFLFTPLSLFIFHPPFLIFLSLLLLFPSYSTLHSSFPAPVLKTHRGALLSSANIKEVLAEQTLHKDDSMLPYGELNTLDGETMNVWSLYQCINLHTHTHTQKRKGKSTYVENVLQCPACTKSSCGLTCQGCSSWRLSLQLWHHEPEVITEQYENIKNVYLSIV